MPLEASDITALADALKKGPFTNVWLCILQYAKPLLDVVQGRAIRF